LIRPTEKADSAAVLEILRASAQFDADGLAFVRDTLDEHLNHPGPAIWPTADDGEPVGVACCALEPVASGTWNLLMLWTRKDRHGQGFGKQLVAHLESELQGRVARLLIVETSGLPAFAVARWFYVRSGFKHEASIKDFFAAGDDKLIFTKSLARFADGLG
jgi:ribosomal protein S18 acetylase RimI-like enzyme